MLLVVQKRVNVKITKDKHSNDISFTNWGVNIYLVLLEQEESLEAMKSYNYRQIFM